MSTITRFSPKGLLKLSSSDLRNIARDPTLLGVLVMSVLLIALFLIFEDRMNDAVLTTFSLPDFSKYIAPIVLVMPAYLIGWIIGFLILEERDEGPLLALDVTPLGKQGIAIYRASFTFFLALTLSSFAIPFLLPDITFLLALALVFLTALQAAIISFAIPALANNKVQGLALTKAMNLFAMAPLLALIASPFRYIASFIPAFWVGEILQLSSYQYIPMALIMALALLCHILVLLYFYRRLLAHSA